MEEFFKASTQDDRWVIEIFWDKPTFICKVTLDSKHILEELSTEDPDEMIRWANKQMKEAARRVPKA